MVPAELLAAAVERAVVAEHVGMSGAALERVRLADGRALMVKRCSPATDLTLALTGAGVAWEHLLRESGVLDRLPRGVSHALVDSWVESDGTTVLAMRDLGDSVWDWDERLDAGRCRWVVDRIARLHAAFLGDRPDGVAPLEPVLGIFAPTRLRAAADAGNRLAAAAIRGWDYFPDHVPADVAELVLALVEDPAVLARALLRRPCTLVHGDLATVNMAADGDDLVLLDWAMPVRAPGAVDLARFLVGCATQLATGREAILELYHGAAGPAYDEEAMRLALLAALVWLGWNKTHDIVESRDPSLRAREQADLDWWVREARTTLERGLL